MFGETRAEISRSRHAVCSNCILLGIKRGVTRSALSFTIYIRQQNILTAVATGSNYELRQSATDQRVGALEPLSDVRLAENARSLEELEENALIAVTLNLLVPRPDLISADVLAPVRRPLTGESDHLLRAHKGNILLGKDRISQFFIHCIRDQLPDPNVNEPETKDRQDESVFVLIRPQNISPHEVIKHRGYFSFREAC